MSCGLKMLVMTATAVAVWGCDAVPAKRGGPARAGSPAYIDARDVHGLLVVPIRVNGSKPVPFMVDTGAMASVLDEGYAKSIGVVLGLRSNLMGLGEGSASLYLVSVDRLDVGKTGLTNLMMVAADLRSFSDASGERIAGVLGGDVLSSKVLELDYARKRVALHEPASFRYGGPGRYLSLRTQWNLLLVRARVAVRGGMSVSGTFMVDTGFAGQGGLAISPGFAKRHGLRKQIIAENQQLGIGMAGELSGDVGELDWLQLGSYKVMKPVTIFPNEAGFLNLPDLDGIIGASVLKDFRVFVDYGRRHLILERRRIGP